MNYKRCRRGNMVEKFIDGAIIVTAAAVLWCQAASAVSSPAKDTQRARVIAASVRPAPRPWEARLAQMGVAPIATRKEFVWQTSR